jgi:hypothetical protein
MMTDSLVETATPATTSAAPSIQEALDMQRRNFFPFPVLWFSLVALEISVLADMRIAETDIWFHLRNAQELLTRHSFLRADFYTFTTAGAPLGSTEMVDGYQRVCDEIAAHGRSGNIYVGPDSSGLYFLVGRKNVTPIL